MQNLDPAPEPKPLTINQEALSPTVIVQLRDGKWPRLRFKDVAKRNMKWRDIDLDGRRRPTTDLPGGDLPNHAEP